MFTLNQHPNSAAQLLLKGLIDIAKVIPALVNNYNQFKGGT